MKKTIHIMMLIAALTIAWGCSSDSSDSGKYTFTTSTARPDWAVDWHNNETVPDWENPTRTSLSTPCISFLHFPRTSYPSLPMMT